MFSAQHKDRDRIAEAEEALGELREALADAGIALPSARLDLASLAAREPDPLVDLGRCNLATVRRLAQAVRTAERSE